MTLTLGAQSKPDAQFIDEKGNVSIGTNLEVGGKLKAKAYEGDGAALNLQENQGLRALQEKKLDNAGGKLSGTLTIKPNSNDSGPALNVDGQIAGDNLWVKLHDVQLSSAADYVVKGINGDGYRQFRIELEGTLNAGAKHGDQWNQWNQWNGVPEWNGVIGLRPNGSTTNYTPNHLIGLDQAWARERNRHNWLQSRPPE